MGWMYYFFFSTWLNAVDDGTWQKRHGWVLIDRNISEDQRKEGMDVCPTHSCPSKGINEYGFTADPRQYRRMLCIVPQQNVFLIYLCIFSYIIKCRWCWLKTEIRHLLTFSDIQTLTYMSFVFLQPTLLVEQVELGRLDLFQEASLVLKVVVQYLPPGEWTWFKTRIKAQFSK